MSDIIEKTNDIALREIPYGEQNPGLPVMSLHTPTGASNYMLVQSFIDKLTGVKFWTPVPVMTDIEIQDLPEDPNSPEALAREAWDAESDNVTRWNRLSDAEKGVLIKQQERQLAKAEYEAKEQARKAEEKKGKRQTKKG